jgi:hypothetical protein
MRSAATWSKNASSRFVAASSAARASRSFPAGVSGGSVCGEPIKRDEVELEIQFAYDGPTPGLERFHVQVRCFAAWEFELAG